MNRFCLLAVGMLCALLIPPASAATFTEMGDAGQTLATAQLVNTQPPGTILTAIFGTMESSGADIFKIYLTGGQTFSATTTTLFNPGNPTVFDSQLFLFNSSGIGVYANDDDNTNGPPQSTLPASLSFTPSSAGVYYLAISGSGFLPLSAGGFIFPVSGGLLNQPASAPWVVGPTGPGGASALTGWSSTSSETGAYEIDLTGAQFLSIPEPSTALLLACGLLIGGVVRRRMVR